MIFWRASLGMCSEFFQCIFVLDDADYDTESMLCYLRRRSIKSNIQSNKHKQEKTSREGPTRFDNESHRNEELSSHSLVGLNLDSGEFPWGMRDSMYVSQVWSFLLHFWLFGERCVFEMSSASICLFYNEEWAFWRPEARQKLFSRLDNSWRKIFGLDKAVKIQIPLKRRSLHLQRARQVRDYFFQNRCLEGH